MQNIRGSEPPEHHTKSCLYTIWYNMICLLDDNHPEIGMCLHRRHSSSMYVGQRVGIHHIASSIILMVLVLLTSSFEVSYRTLPPCDVQTFNILDRESAPLSKIYYYQWGFFVLLTLTALDAMYSHFQSAYKTITPIKMEALPLVWVAHWYKTPIWFRNHHLCLKGKHA